jgi:hypothetical protein
MLDELKLVVPIIQWLKGELGERAIINSHSRIDVMLFSRSR